MVHVEHTARAFRQPVDISQPTEAPSQPYVDELGETVIEVDRILSHRRRGRGWQFLTLYKNAQFHDAEWKPVRDFFDSDNSITKALHDYIIENDMLHHLH